MDGEGPLGAIALVLSVVIKLISVLFSYLFYVSNTRAQTWCLFLIKSFSLAAPSVSLLSRDGFQGIKL